VALTGDNIHLSPTASFTTRVKAPEPFDGTPLIAFSGLDRLWVVAIHGAVCHIPFGEDRLELFDDLIGVDLKGVLNLDLKDHVTAAFQVRTKADEGKAESNEARNADAVQAK